MWNVDICKITHLPCIRCNSGGCAHRQRMCDGCKYYRLLDYTQHLRVCHYCADGNGRTKRLPSGLCANYAALAEVNDGN